MQETESERFPGSGGRGESGRIGGHVFQLRSETKVFINGRATDDPLSDWRIVNKDEMRSSGALPDARFLPAALSCGSRCFFFPLLALSPFSSGVLFLFVISLIAFSFSCSLSFHEVSTFRLLLPLLLPPSALHLSNIHVSNGLVSRYV